jgi:hypothetical protein
MSGKTGQQEIILSFQSGFLSMNCAEKGNTESPGTPMDSEKIEEACWNGLLKEILPEICNMSFSGRQMFIWGIRDYNSIMEIDIGEFPAEKDDFLCIDPYKFMAARTKALHN